MFVCFFVFLGTDDHAKGLQDVSIYLQHNCKPVEAMDTMMVRLYYIGYDYMHVNYDNTALDLSGSAYLELIFI